MNKEQVRKFYELIWDNHNTAAISTLLDPSVTFRGSLGQEKRGHAGFAAYVDMVHKALGDYHCIIEELVAEGDKVFAKMTFTGIHRDDFMGYCATQKRVTWTGCALFSFKQKMIVDIWVLGDLKSLEEQLLKNARQSNH